MQRFVEICLDKPAADISVDYTTTETVDSEDSDSSKIENGAAETAATSAGNAAETAVESTQETADTEETESETETVQVAKQLILHIGSQNGDGDYYAALDGSKEVHVVSGDTVKELIEKKAADFTDNAILSGSLNNAKSIDVASAVIAGIW